MPYDRNDPRAQLAVASKAAAGVPRPAQYVSMVTPALPASPASGGTRWVRAQHAVVGYSDGATGASLVRADQPDEYVVFLASAGSTVTVEAGDEVVSVRGEAVVVVPPGSSRVTADEGGVVVWIFSAVADDLVARCANADAYTEPDPNVAPWRPWPRSPAGDAVRVYPLADVPSEPGRFGRIFRCSTVMVNVLAPDDGPRDPSKLSPHHHDDFEQISLQLEGDYVHHMRTPWTPDLTTWRDDEHMACASPAVVVIPPPMVHTSQGVGDMRHWLVDVFAPPRFDFSQRPGWVLNRDDYPMPDDGQETT